MVWGPRYKKVNIILIIQVFYVKYWQNFSWIHLFQPNLEQTADQARGTKINQIQIKKLDLKKCSLKRLILQLSGRAYFRTIDRLIHLSL